LVLFIKLAVGNRPWWAIVVRIDVFINKYKLKYKKLLNSKFYYLSY